ncbi:MAG: 4-oxalocrotonate tautomerase [Candidatus Lambdaproteobacteria bacterium RIFOXYD12_FULL_49_8]|uniref:4-oxalocrotonate tautomerase n=1 Tax=Candidatus Lambdaproteobacteria bacterium RIFOXYD2_FULL_50_16 TaxID=1817772 RepID=A0A1F6GAI2_9PROT|nr:MAG: 4-oxalocrotonate tautomerase [Candidatus Lambdaproteobacteria bacterium RIFOXYD2_FULL_50_16]OGG98005.1 MAG: 4-oxalocrotonate tautomerase [Candidatus Lambdaproteobacteria bacterium RIFOXYD12_FULL_49_8]
MIRIYGLKEQLNPIKARLSDQIAEAMFEALGYPKNKRAQRFFPMEPEDFYYPEGRSPAYTVIEISLITGRSIEAKKRLIKLLFEKIALDPGIAPADLEITLFEAPAAHWGFRGITGDEAILDYKIEV